MLVPLICFNAFAKNNASSTQVIIPVHSQKIAFQLPSTWKAAFEDKKKDSYLIEFTPKNESINSWNNLISIQGFRGLAFMMSAEQFLDKIASRFKSICGENAIYEKTGASKIDGNATYNAILGCSDAPAHHSTGKNKNQSEIGYYYSIQGENDMYLIHKSIRGKPFKPTNSPLKEANIQAFIKAITPIELCKNEGSPTVCIK